MTRRFWSVIESPFQAFAAWVDEEGRLLRFNLRATGAAKVDREAENNPRKLAHVQRQVNEYAKGKRRALRNAGTAIYLALQSGAKLGLQ